MADGPGDDEPGLLAAVKSAIRKDLDLDFVKKVKVELKGERTESRILALSTYRLYTLVSSKLGCKVETSVHILSIQSIESTKPLTLTISTGDKSQFIKVSQPKDCIEIIAYILAALKSTFPSGNPDRLLRLTLKSDSDHGEVRQEQVTTLANNLRNAEADADIGPCGGFSRVYACMCDYHGLPYLEEVAWDVDTIYLSHDTKEFNLQDFDNLEQKELVPIISTLEYNSWFTKLTCRSFKLSSDVCDTILRVLKKSMSIEELVLDGVSLGREYFHKVGLALTSNPKSAINVLDLSNNSMEDRGLNHLTGIIGKLPQGLVALVLADNGLTAKGSLTLGQALKSSKHMGSSLKRLNLCRNPLKPEGVGALSDFIANPNALTHLDLSHTECCLDVLFGALLRGCVQTLMHLHLAGNSFTSKKKEVTIPQSFQQFQEGPGRDLYKFFSMSQVLELVDLSDCKLPADAVRAILLGLTENTVLVGIVLNLSKNELKSAGAAALAEYLGKVKSIKTLDISDNGLEGDLVKVLESLESNQSVQHLCIGQNFEKRNSNAGLETLVQLISGENSHLHTLSIADSKLKQEIIPLLDALGTNETLIELDISGNNMGDEGVRILAKALQLNAKLRTLHWDRNGTSHRGFGDISAALASNHTLHSMPTPLQDSAQCIKYHNVEVEQHLRKIEKYLLRNQSPHKIVTEQAYRLQQGLLVASTQQQAVDRLIVQLQDLIHGLRNSKDTQVKEQVSEAKHYIQDADKMKQLLLKFQLCTSDSDIEAKFARLSEEFYRSSQAKMKHNIEQMIECAQEVCPYITAKDDVKKSLSVSEGKKRLSQTFVEEVILTQAAAAILNRLSEDKLTAASVMADTIMDVMIRHMETCSVHLELLLKEHRKKQALAVDEERVLDDTDDVSVAARKAKNRLSSAHQLAGENAEEVPKSHRRRPTVSRARKKDAGSISEEIEVDIDVDGGTAGLDARRVSQEEVKSLPVLAKKKAPTPPKGAANLDLNAVEQTGSDLQHLVKERARPARGRRLPTRPSNKPQVANGTESGEQKESADIDSFWAPKKDEPAARRATTPSRPPRPAVSPSPGKTPPKPAPKPKPRPASKHTEESRKSGWIPKGGINLGLPGFFKKKRDRSGSGQEANDTTAVQEKPKRSPSPKREKEKKPSPKPSPPKPAAPRDRAPFGSGPKPAVKPRDRIATAPGRPPVAQVRDRSATSGTGPQVAAGGPVKESAKEEESLQGKPAAPRGPPKFGIGIGGMAGGGLLAEMKMRQERSGSFGDKTNKPERKTSAEDVAPVTRPRVPTGEREVEKEKISEEGLVRPSSVKRPRVPSASGPKPYVKPREKLREERKEEKKEAIKKEEEPERPARRKPSKGPKESVDGGKTEETANGNVEEPKKEKLEIDKPDDADLWVKRDDLPSPKRSPRSPRATSPPLKLETSQPAKHDESLPARSDGTTPPAKHDTVSPLKRAATLPKPWSPSSAPTSRSLPRKFSWEADKKTEELFKDQEKAEKGGESREAKADEGGEGKEAKTEKKSERKDSSREEKEEEVKNGVEEKKDDARTSPPEEKPAETSDETNNIQTKDKIPRPADHTTCSTDASEPINDPLGVSRDMDESDTVL